MRAMSGAREAAAVLAGALLFDLVVGEPPNALHPVVWMGNLQGWLRRRAPRDPAGQLIWGAFMAAAGPVVFGGGTWLLLRAIHAEWLRIGVAVYLLKSSFAVRALAFAAARVGRALVHGDIDGARVALRSLVSRDVSTLDPPRLAAAAIESVAENTSDSVVAPIFYFLIFGVPGALAYRAANTLDAMIGYHGETEWLGKVAARLDDLLNLIPARLTAAMLVVASACTGASAFGAVRIWWRDGGVTESPNAGRPMAAMAGALGVELEKRGCYKLGAGLPPPSEGDIGRAIAIVATACALVVIAAWTVLWSRA
jgi:adenosylcobinamide-phosphate synthase